jgi:hypothetical protein
MGNGYTFALMTLFFSATVKTLYDLSDIPEYGIFQINGVPERRKTWAVYGDDIIVDKRVYSALISIMTSFGLIINIQKTCSDPYRQKLPPTAYDSLLRKGSPGDLFVPVFRESCGGDYMDGRSVRPVFVESLDTQADVFSIFNRLVLWGVTHSVNLKNSLELLVSAIPLEDRLRVPNWEDVSHGFHVPVCLAYPNKKNFRIPEGFPREMQDSKNFRGRWYEHLSPKPKQRALFYERVTEAKYSCVLTRNVYVNKMTIQRERQSRPITNDPGLVLSVIGGYVRGGKYGIRDNGTVLYTKSWSWCPSWGDPSLFSLESRSTRPQASHVYVLWEKYLVRNIVFKFIKHNPLYLKKIKNGSDPS